MIHRIKKFMLQVYTWPFSISKLKKNCSLLMQNARALARNSSVYMTQAELSMRWANYRGEVCILHVHVYEKEDKSILAYHLAWYICTLVPPLLLRKQLSMCKRGETMTCFVPIHEESGLGGPTPSSTILCSTSLTLWCLFCSCCLPYLSDRLPLMLMTTGHLLLWERNFPMLSIHKIICKSSYQH